MYLQKLLWIVQVIDKLENGLGCLSLSHHDFMALKYENQNFIVDLTMHADFGCC